MEQFKVIIKKNQTSKHLCQFFNKWITFLTQKARKKQGKSKESVKTVIIKIQVEINVENTSN